MQENVSSKNEFLESKSFSILFLPFGQSLKMKIWLNLVLPLLLLGLILMSFVKHRCRSFIEYI